MPDSQYRVTTADGRVITVEAPNEAVARRSAAEYVMRNPKADGESQGEGWQPAQGTGTVNVGGQQYAIERSRTVPADSPLPPGAVPMGDGSYFIPRAESTAAPDSIRAADADARRVLDANENTPREGSGVQMFNDGASFGFADELNANALALAAAAKDALGGDNAYTPGQLRDAYEAAYNERMGRFDQSNPVSAFALRGVGSLASPGALAGGEFVSAGRNLFTQGARGAALGSVAGGLYGAGSAQGGLEERGQGAVRGAEAGAVLGATLPAAARGVSALAEPLVAPFASAARGTARRMQGVEGIQPSDTATAERIVREMAARANVTPQTIPENMLVQAGRDVNAAHLLGRDAQTQLAAIGRRDGPIGDQLAEDIYMRQGGQGDRVLDDFAELGVDPRQAAANVEQFVQSAREGVGPQFDAALAGSGPIDDPALQALLRRPAVARAARAVYDDILNAGGNPEAEGLRVVQRRMGAGGTVDQQIEFSAPTAQTLDKIKKAMGRQVERNPLTGRPLPDTQAEGNYGIAQASKGVTQAMREVIPGYGDALDAASNYMQVNSAYERASGALFGRRMSTRDFGKLWASAKTPAEREAIQQALANDLFNAVENGTLRPNQLLVPRVKAKIQLAFGSRADRFIQRVQAEARMAGMDRRMLPGTGSPTAELTQAMRGQDASQAGVTLGAAGDLAQGRPLAAVGRVAGNLIMNAMKRPGLSPEARQELGRLLMMDETQLVEFLSRPEGQAAAQRLGITTPAIAALRPPQAQRESQ